MFAIVDIGGKQYRAEVGRELVVDRMTAEEGATVELDAVLISGDDGAQFDEVKPAAVTATVVEHLRGPKLIIFKFKPKRGFKRKNGFRSALTRLSIDKIG
ncbi:MAG TPA: 50S ribosomal protein L21 [Thermoleophilia bacterium]|nr:50S ribosomal protein L21 [Thermoleophilia bacterium]